MISYQNLIKKFYRKIDRFLFIRIYRRLLLKFCYIGKIAKLPYPPEYLQIDITGFCNLKCKMCPQSEKNIMKEKGIMDFALYQKIIDSGREAGVFSILLVLTGEPLLHNRLLDMIIYAKSKKLKVQISTNCTLLTPEKSKEIIESGLDEIILSFDTVNRARYEDYRSGANFDMVLSNIINFLELRRKMGTRRPFVIMANLQPYKPDKPNAKIEEDFLKTFGKYDVWIMPKYFSNWSGIMENQKEISYSESSINNGSVYKICETIYHRLVVSWDAKVLSCCNDFIRAQVVGDLTQQSIAEVWNGYDFVNLRRKLIEGKYNELPLCKNCGVLWKRAKI